MILDEPSFYENYQDPVIVLMILVIGHQTAQLLVKLLVHWPRVPRFVIFFYGSSDVEQVG